MLNSFVIFKSFSILFSYTSFFILNIVIVLLVVLIGGVLPLYERKFLSLTQRRVGPKFTGFRGRLQFLADALKVLWKELITLYKLNSFLLFLVPILYLNINLVFFINIYWFSNLSSFDIEYNIVFFIILDLVIHSLIVLIGFYLQNKYTIIASNRLINISFSLEIFILIIDSVLFFIVESFSFQYFFLLKNNCVLLYSLVFLSPYLVLFFLLETAKTPFDIVEAETEIIMGYHVEYSGFLFGLFVLSEYFHLLISIYVVYLVAF